MTIRLDPAHGPERPMPLPDFRRAVVAQDPLTAAERHLILDQAQLLVDHLYAHLAQKRAMYHVHPGRRLRRLAARQGKLDDLAFHRAMLGIFDALRDMHTSYVLPEPYRGHVLLGFGVECYWADRERRFVVSKPGPDKNPPVPYGAEITHWNGLPIEEAVRRNAKSEAGGNAAASFAQGLDSLTLRNAALSPLPSEDEVRIRYELDGATHECVVPWMVETDPDGLRPETGEDLGSAARRLGVSLRTEKRRQIKAARLRNGGRRRRGRVSIPTPYQEVTAWRITTASGVFGHLRIRSFEVPKEDIATFLENMQELLGRMPKKGLIIDVRANPGGHIEAAEGLLGLLTSRQIQPEPMQFVNSALTYELCGRSRELFPWRRSIGEAKRTAEAHSAGVPLSVVPRAGQAYGGPVVLVTDALSYSATDMFAAGFQDNNVGWVLGVDPNTGAGGANVWNIPLLLEAWPDGPFRPMPKGSRLRVALRRSLRVGRSAGLPVEDLGVVPDVRYRMTRRDVTEENADLLERAGELLVELARDREQE